MSTRSTKRAAANGSRSHTDTDDAVKLSQQSSYFHTTITNIVGRQPTARRRSPTCHQLNTGDAATRIPSISPPPGRAVRWCFRRSMNSDTPAWVCDRIESVTGVTPSQRHPSVAGKIRSPAARCYGGNTFTTSTATAAPCRSDSAGASSSWKHARTSWTPGTGWQSQRSTRRSGPYWRSPHAGGDVPRSSAVRRSQVTLDGREHTRRGT